jgi:hypothetical protein
MLKILEHWKAIVYFTAALKVLAILLVPIGGDFLSWTISASRVLHIFLAGKIPSLSAYGVYLGIDTFLAPFFWIWTILPIEHPQLRNIVNHTAPAIYLGLIMKLPIFLFDIVSLVLLLRLARRITKSPRNSSLAGLTWFVNPFNFYMMYFFGAMDIIPIAIFLLAINFGLDNRWFRCGFSTVAAGLLRLFAFAALPFFLPLTKTRTTRSSFVVGSLLAMAFVIVGLYLTNESLATVLSLPAKEVWLLEFLGLGIGTQFVKLTPVLILLQLYIVIRYWRHDSNVVHLASVSLLAILVGATVYGGSSQHFLWVSPLLSACLAIHPKEWWIFALTFLSALLSPTVNPFGSWTPAHPVVDTFLSGAFYGMKATYLVRLNLLNLYDSNFISVSN